MHLADQRSVIGVCLGTMLSGSGAGAIRVGIDHGDQASTGMRGVVPRMMRAEISKAYNPDPDFMRLVQASPDFPNLGKLDGSRTIPG